MTVGFILNGEDMTIKVDPEVRLVDILRDIFNLNGTRAGCRNGSCGVCSIIFNGDVVKSCLVPAFKIQESEIITIEGFSQTDEYQDIVSGFYESGVENCGFCDTGKILAAEALMGKSPRPSRTEILFAFQGIKCRCTDPDELVQGVLAAIEKRRRRLYGRSS